jgi:hypothetical protein
MASMTKKSYQNTQHTVRAYMTLSSILHGDRKACCFLAASRNWRLYYLFQILEPLSISGGKFNFITLLQYDEYVRIDGISWIKHNFPKISCSLNLFGHCCCNQRLRNQKPSAIKLRCANNKKSMTVSIYWVNSALHW